MKKKRLLRTNILLCILLTAGFTAVYAVNYSSNNEMLRRDVEYISKLTRESIYYQIHSYFERPIGVSMTMATDNLLKTFLLQEPSRMGDESYIAELQQYLHAYKEQYGYDSVFLVSAETRRYYRHSGLDRVLSTDNPENKWYFDFLGDAEDYTLDVDQDESQSADRAATTFINCKIYADDGGVLGVVGVGFRVEHLQELLKSYNALYGVNATLIDDDGVIFSEHLNSWVERTGKDYYVASQYIPAMKWRLVVENDTSEITAQYRYQLLIGLCITVLIAALVLVIVNKVVLTFNERLLKLMVSQEMEYHTLIKKATEEMYTDVYEFDITRGRAVGDGTRSFFESLGLSPDADFRQAMETLAEKQVKEEFRKGFLNLASQEHILKVFASGEREIQHDVMVNTHWPDYRWVRIHARLFFWNADQSVHMIIYSRQIHDEKMREEKLLRESLTDPLTGLYNRRFMDEQLERITKILARADGIISVLMIDVDFFKKYNDTYGHILGDACLKKIAALLLKAVTRADDIAARYGGEEFLLALPNTDSNGARFIAQRIMRGLEECIIPHEQNPPVGYVTVSVGGVTGRAADIRSLAGFVDEADKALYESKKNGRNCFTGKLIAPVDPGGAILAEP